MLRIFQINSQNLIIEYIYRREVVGYPSYVAVALAFKFRKISNPSSPLSTVGKTRTIYGLLAAFLPFMVVVAVVSTFIALGYYLNNG